MNVGVLKFVHVGYGYVLCMNRIVGVFPPRAEPTKRMVRFAKANDTYIDMCRGNETKSIILMEDGTLVGVAFNPMTIYRRLNADQGIKAAKMVKAKKFPEEEIDDGAMEESEEDELIETAPEPDEEEDI